jgi:ubiquinone/menaquinone biosynthesis C-methylase UbiE
MDALTEPEIQLLIALLELASPVETPNNNFYRFYPKTLEDAATYFRKFRADWAAAYGSLRMQGLLAEKEGSALSMPALTVAGRTEAERLRAARPPIWYWYEEFFAEATHSAAYARFCERLYGRNLCQAGFSDMTQLDTLLEILTLNQYSRVLDLGCGAGMVAEYIADSTGAQVTGIDYSPTAIAEAQARTAAKRHRLSFRLGNLDELPLPVRSFDALIAIDSLYMPNDLDRTLAQMQSILRPGGRMTAFHSHGVAGGLEARKGLRAEGTPLGQALQRAGLMYETQDWSAETYRLLQRKRSIAEEMRTEFAAEGRLFLYEHLMAESQSDQSAYEPNTATMCRYLYVIPGTPTARCTRGCCAR